MSYSYNSPVNDGSMRKGWTIKMGADEFAVTLEDALYFGLREFADRKQ